MHTLLIDLMRLTKHFQHEILSTVPLRMHFETLQELCTMKEKKMKQKKEMIVTAPAAKKYMWATPTTLIVVVLAVLKHVTQLPKGFTTGNNPTHQRVASKDSKEKKKTGHFQHILAHLSNF